MKIRLERRSHDWIAYVNDDLACWGCGKTEAEAVWDVLRSHARDLNIEIVQPPDDIAHRANAALQEGLAASFKSGIGLRDVPQWAKDLTEEVLGGAPFKVGGRVKHPDGYDVEITDGQYWGTRGLSNFWYWRRVLPNGQLSPEVEQGYGWANEEPHA